MGEECFPDIFDVFPPPAMDLTLRLTNLHDGHQDDDDDQHDDDDDDDDDDCDKD